MKRKLVRTSTHPKRQAKTTSAHRDHPAPAAALPPKPDVGARLKTLRTERNLSQRDLAAMSGVTNGMISMIEQNKHSPSVATLNRITDALRISFGEFFGNVTDAPSQPQIFFQASDLKRLIDGKVEVRVVGDGRSGQALQILHEIYQPGGDTGPEMLSHPGEEGGIVISGEVEIFVGEAHRKLVAGDAYYFDSRIPHRFRNCGAAPAILVSASTSSH
ncbi:MAG TPA: cupin domain-containing protein [Hyphomicrobium sp.]|nr:cupin domain-containing protein [Hyphomicrobium sp.]